MRDPDDEVAWEQFFRLYAPMLLRYARCRGLSVTDAEEVRDHVLAIVARKMPAFEYRRVEGGFRNWLFTIANARVVDLMRRKTPRHLETRDLQQIPDRDLGPAEAWHAQWRKEHLAYGLSQARWRVSACSYRAFELLLHDGWSVRQVCDELGMNENQVYKAKLRVLKAIRAVLTTMGDEEDPEAPRA